MKKRILCLMTGLSIILMSGCGKESSSSDLPEDIKTVSVVTTENSEYSEYVKYSGFVSSDELKRFSFELGGKISGVYVEEGQEVKAGDVLASLDTESIQMAIDNANENIKLANNQIAQADNQIKALNISLEAERLTLEKAQTGLEAEKLSLTKIEQSYNSSIAKIQLQYDNAEETFNSISDLYKSGVVAKTDYDSAKLAFDTAAEELDNAKQTKQNDMELQQKKINSMQNDYDLQQTSIKNTENSIEAAEVKRQAANISLEQAKISLEQNTKYLNDSTLKSTIDGYVMSIALHAGEVTGAGTPVVIIKSGKEVINTGVPVDDYSRLNIGMKASIDADGTLCSGEITNISLYPDEATRTYNVEITPENQTLAMGSLVNITIDINQKSGCFVPISSVMSIDGVDYVYIAEENENGKFKIVKKQITLGEQMGENVLAADLDSGLRVISKGIKDISENEIVYIGE